MRTACNKKLILAKSVLQPTDYGEKCALTNRL